VSRLSLNPEQQAEALRVAQSIASELGGGKTLGFLEEKFCSELSAVTPAGQFQEAPQVYFAEGQRSVVLFLKDMMKLAGEQK